MYSFMTHLEALEIPLVIGFPSRIYVFPTYIYFVSQRFMPPQYGLSAALGAVAGILITPIALTSWDVGIMLGLKGFAAAVLGGLGSGPGAVLGGLLLGIAEALSAGYLSSAYKDVIAFILMLAVLFFMPTGILGRRAAERV